jgi:hypothetical protein
MFWVERRRIAQLVSEIGLPAIYENVDLVEAGGVMAPKVARSLNEPIGPQQHRVRNHNTECLGRVQLIASSHFVACSTGMVSMGLLRHSRYQVINPREE